MTIIQFDIEDKLVREVGMKTVKDFVESQLSILRLISSGKRITDAIEESGIVHNQIVEESRQEAWREYKERHLKDML
jgi:hypothetical protein